MLKLCFLALCACLLTSTTSALKTTATSDSVPDFCVQVTKLGYPCETVYIPTPDGFLLGTPRIPQKQPGAYSVILQHGLFDSAISWVMNAYGYQNLATMLHDAGYDVWMPNSRGSIFSMNNTIYTQSDPTYWRLIDADMMALYDIPACVDYILNSTGRQKLTFLGMSAAGFSGFGAFLVDSTMKDKVDLHIELAPVVYFGHVENPVLQFLAKLHIDDIMKYFGDKEFGTPNNFAKDLVKLCPNVTWCPDIIAALWGKALPNSVNMSQLSLITQFDPSGTSINNVVHFVQLVRNDNYAMHDFGPADNMKYYNQTTAPLYNLSDYGERGVPTMIFSGTTDILADPTDMQRLLNEVPKEKVVYQEVFTGWSHIDFNWGLTAHQQLYPTLIQFIQKYESN